MTALRDRLFSEAGPCPDPGCTCLLWARPTTNGYGFLYAEGRTRGVHRIAYELEFGPIADGLTIDHVHERGCRHKNCVNVAHLEAVTWAENNRRAKALITHCPQGHAYDEANTYRPPGRPTARYCWQCIRDRKAGDV